MIITGLKAFIVQWNNDHPLDKRYREKYNIAFNSSEHRAISQLDILVEYLEGRLFDEHEEIMEKQLKKDELFNKGVWLSDREVPEESTIDLFDKIDISAIGKDSQIQIE